jgi:hypothetical protein
MAQTPQVPQPSGYPARSGTSPLAHTAMIGVAVVIAGVFAWLVFDALRAAWHIVELVVVGGAMAWGGYRVGRWRGRRDAQHPRA